MFIKNCALAMAAAGFLAAEPCVAAPDPGEGWNDRRVSAFAGVNVRIPMGAATGARPSARLQLASSYNVRNVRTGAVRTFQPQGLELGAATSGGATFYMNGQTRADLQKKLRLSGSTDTVLIIFGVALVAVAVLVLSNDAELPGPPI